MIWSAGVNRADTTDVLSSRLHLGKAFGSIVVLAGNLGVAVGDILGGIARQTSVLVAKDVAMQEKEPPTYRAASLTLMIEAVLVVAVLIVLVAARLMPGAVAIAGLWLSGKASRGLPWQDASGTALDRQKGPKGHSQGKKDKASS